MPMKEAFKGAAEMKEEHKHHKKHHAAHPRHINMPHRKLGDGHAIPAFGLGTLNMNENEVGDIVKSAIFNGFRMFDTSPVYKNEKAIG